MKADLLHFRTLQAKEEAELPEYILGTVRLNRVEVDSAVALEVWGPDYIVNTCYLSDQSN